MKAWNAGAGMDKSIFYSAWMLCAGIGIPIMSALTARLGSAYTNTGFAILVLLIGAVFLQSIFLLWSDLSKKTWVELPWYYYASGALFLFYIFSISRAVPHFGLGNCIFFILLGQLLCALVVDHYGFFGVMKKPITLQQIFGLSITVVGIYLLLHRKPLT